VSEQSNLLCITARETYTFIHVLFAKSSFR
jgi:hypothetical protein